LFPKIGLTTVYHGLPKLGSAQTSNRLLYQIA
jgi:hypothetical protein